MKGRAPAMLTKRLSAPQRQEQNLRHVLGETQLDVGCFAMTCGDNSRGGRSRSASARSVSDFVLGRSMRMLEIRKIMRAVRLSLPGAPGFSCRLPLGR